MIPKILYLYWGRNRPMSYLHWLTAETFSKLNPDWKINVYYPTVPFNEEYWTSGEHKENKYNGKDWFDNLTDIKNLHLRKSNIELMIPEVMKSDYLRWKLLAEYGGLWSDFDILYIRPMIDLTGHSAILSSWMTSGKIKINPVAFMAGSIESDLFRDALNLATENIETKNRNYQKLGCLILNKILENKKYIYTDIDYRTVYPIISENLKQCWEKDTLTFSTQTIGIHWFAGASIAAKFISEINGPSKIDKKLNLFKNYEI